MSLFLPFRRASLLIPSGPAHDPERKHFFILLTNPYSHPDTNVNSVLLVSICSVQEQCFHDSACYLYPGDHPFINRKSYVAYNLARIEAADKLTRGVKAGLFVQQEIVADEVFARICHGLSQSRHTAPAIINFYTAASKRDE